MCDFPSGQGTAEKPLISPAQVKAAGGGLHALLYACPRSDPRIETPGMVLNLETIGKLSPKERKSTIFHETLHLLGYLHTAAARAAKGMDYVYSAELCCFGDGKKTETEPVACDQMLKYAHEATIDDAPGTGSAKSESSKPLAAEGDKSSGAESQTVTTGAPLPPPPQ
jgi:hypothetical protein